MCVLVLGLGGSPADGEPPSVPGAGVLSGQRQ